jgi:tetratricopeptide (TPR) repeat protein
MKIVEQTKTKLVLREFSWNVVWFCILWVVPAISGALFFEQNIIWTLVVVIACSAAVCFISEIVTCTFDKSLNSIILKRQKLLKTKLVEYSIEAISGIKLEVMSGDDGKLYRVSMMLDSGKCVPLTPAYTSDLRDNKKTAENIATFLNVFNYGLGEPKIPASSEDLTEISKAWQKAMHLKAAENLSQNPQVEIAHWQALIRLNPNDAEAYRNLGMALYIQDKKGNKKEALASLRKSYELFKAQDKDEEHSISFYLYGWIYWGSSKVKKLRT